MNGAPVDGTGFTWPDQLPDNLPLLRSCLFYEVRAHRHGADTVPFDSNEFVRALVSRIREVSRGSVPVMWRPE